jgi:hypothetical protein
MAMDSAVMVVMMVTVVTEGSWPVQMVDDVAGLRMGGADARRLAHGVPGVAQARDLDAVL